MRSKLILLLTMAILFTFSSNAWAKEYKMIFWYPGEAGSTVEAQPVLDAFFKYLNGKTAPDTISGRYFNTVGDGLNYIKNERPVVGIVSYATLAQNRDKIGNVSTLLSTLQLPDGKTTEKYSLVVKADSAALPASILSSEPLGMPFVREQLFPQVSSTAKITSTPQLLMKLKDISEGKLNAGAILTPTEAAALHKISAVWAKGLKSLSESKPVPTAQVMLFDQEWKGSDKLKAALITIGADPGAADVLTEMRLKGFAEQ